MAVVTGAGRGIGREHALSLAAHGAKVVVNDISLAAAQKTVDFIRSRGCEAIAFEGDATKEDVVAAATAKAVSHYGHLDVIFNMAGIVLWKSVLEMDILTGAGERHFALQSLQIARDQHHPFGIWGLEFGISAPDRLKIRSLVEVA